MNKKPINKKVDRGGPGGMGNGDIPADHPPCPRGLALEGMRWRELRPPPGLRGARAAHSQGQGRPGVSGKGLQEWSAVRQETAHLPQVEVVSENKRSICAFDVCVSLFKATRCHHWSPSPQKRSTETHIRGHWALGYSNQTRDGIRQPQAPSLCEGAP